MNRTLLSGSSGDFRILMIKKKVSFVEGRSPCTDFPQAHPKDTAVVASDSQLIAGS